MEVLERKSRPVAWGPATRGWDRHSSVGWVGAALLLLCVGSYHFVVVYTLVFTNGLCCADDSFIATVAKNLSLGYGYASSEAGVRGLHPFNYGISTGPTLVIPAALLISVFGNTPWAPGFVTASFAGVLLLVLLRHHLTAEGPVAACIYVSLFLFLTHCFTIWHFEHWYALLGEIPAALLGAVALTRFASGTRSVSRLIESSLLSGFAVMAKYLAVLSYVPILAALLFSVIRDGGGRRDRIQQLGISLGCFLAPVVLFELWHLKAVGVGEYVKSTAQLISFVSYAHSSGGSGNIGSCGRLARNYSQFSEHFGFSPFAVLALSALSLAALAARPSSRRMLRPAAALCSASLIHFAYWLAISPGWPRYIIIGLVLYAAAVALIVYGVQSLIAAIVALGAIFTLHVPAPDRLLYPARLAFQDGPNSPSERLRHLRETADFLKSRHDSALFVSEAWMTVADLEYILPTVDNFRRSDNIEPTDVRGAVLLVRNTFWSNFWSNFAKLSEVGEAADWARGCHEKLLDRPPYEVARCPLDKERFDHLSRVLANAHVRYQQAPVPSIRFRAGDVELFAHAPTVLALDVPAKAGTRSLEVTFGIDNGAWRDGNSNGVCFIVRGVSGSGEQAAFMSECLDPKGTPADRGARTRILLVPSDTSQLILETDPRGDNQWDWSYWRDVTLRPGAW